MPLPTSGSAAASRTFSRGRPDRGVGILLRSVMTDQSTKCVFGPRLRGFRSGCGRFATTDASSKKAPGRAGGWVRTEPHAVRPGFLQAGTLDRPTRLLAPRLAARPQPPPAPSRRPLDTFPDRRSICPTTFPYHAAGSRIIVGLSRGVRCAQVFCRRRFDRTFGGANATAPRPNACVSHVCREINWWPGESEDSCRPAGSARRHGAASS
jgi:hypothetical protein